MASLKTMFAHLEPRVDHVGIVVTPPELLVQRRAERDARLRQTQKMALATIAGGAGGDKQEHFNG